MHTWPSKVRRRVCHLSGLITRSISHDSLLCPLPIFLSCAYFHPYHSRSFIGALCFSVWCVTPCPLLRRERELQTHGEQIHPQNESKLKFETCSWTKGKEAPLRKSILSSYLLGVYEEWIRKSSTWLFPYILTKWSLQEGAQGSLACDLELLNACV